jgi:uncharacterized protein (TIGR03067 family)
MKWVWRVLLGLIGLLVLGLVTLLALGARSDAGMMRASVEIARTPATVWPWLQDPEKLKAWVGWLVEVRQTGPDREVWVMEDRNNGNMRVEILGVTTAKDQPRRLAVHTTTPGEFDGDHSYVLTDLGGRTRLEMEEHFHFSERLAQLMEPLITHEARVKMVDDLARLKSLIESKPEESIARDLDNLQGTWKLTALEANGQATPPAAFKGATLAIRGDAFESIAAGAVQTGTVEVNPAASPKAFDLIYKATSDTPAYRSRGIYELHGNTWRACFTAREGTRPSEFATSPGSGLVLDVLEREP